MLQSSDDGLFDDEINNESLDSLLSKPKVTLSTQRDLLGQAVYVDVRDEAAAAAKAARAPVVFAPTHHYVEYAQLDTYVYPTNFEVRDYQFNIVRHALYRNLLVALPTGLGKTFIALTVMLNFHRWFPRSKIIFMAPTRPLVAQQIKACCGVTGILSAVVATLLDKAKRNRQQIWDSKTVFFTTPQVVENDLLTGVLDARLVVLLVIDEAHRSKGNYLYHNVVKLINRAHRLYRILALTATPAADVEGVQQIIDNLSISRIEVRTEHSIDIVPHLKRKRVERFLLTSPSAEIAECVLLLCDAAAPVLKLANERGIYDMRDALKINAFQVMEASQRLRSALMPEGLKWLSFYVLQLLAVVGQALRRLVVYGVRLFYLYFGNKCTEFGAKKSSNKLAASFYLHDSVRCLLALCEQWVGDDAFLGHPKLGVIVTELTKFFAVPTSSRCIIFTEFRELALEIVRTLEQQRNANLRPHIFIGQAKEKEKFDEEKLMARKPKPADLTSSESAQVKGMTQKLQKELIKKFKRGDFNVLVATSIGEEGLDIGEVDLIICYDSTGSPIKNIQRMGRTGRKRDGKVMLLFSANEEQKFDKAMGGYDYIQQHIMSGKLIELSQSDRIIPQQYTPIVKKSFIEIPEENEQLVKQEDEDEIIKIATQYMKTKPAKPRKAQKKFYMPSNVESGFTLAKDLVRKVGEKDVLDRIMDSLDEDKKTLPSKQSAEPAPLNVGRKTLGVKRYKQADLMGLVKPGPATAASSGASEDDRDDVFDDGLDDDLITIKQSSATPAPSQTDSVFQNDFEGADGLLNQEERTRLYTFYYTAPAEAAKTYYDPSHGLRNAIASSVSHARRAQRFIDTFKRT